MKELEKGVKASASSNMIIQENINKAISIVRNER